MFLLEEKGDLIFIRLSKESIDQLGTLQYVDLIHPGRVLQTDEVFGTLEGSRMNLSLEAPFGCVVERVNENIQLLPENIQSDNLNKSWLICVYRF